MENELKEKFLNILQEYFDNLNPYDFDNETWDNIKIKYKITIEKIETIEKDDKIEAYSNEYIQEFKDFVKGENTLKSEELSSREIFLRNIQQIGDKVLHGIAYVWEKIKFLFAIPGITFASFVFTFFITLVFGTFLTWLFPQAYNELNDGIIDAIFASVIFILIRYFIFRDIYLNHPDINVKTYLIKHFIASFVWWFIFFFIRYKEADNVFSFSYFEWAIYLPYLTIPALTHEFFISAIINYFVINLIPFIAILIYIFFMEKFFDKRQKYVHDSDIRIQEDYDYHFDINSEVNLGKYADNTKEEKQEKDEIK